MNARGFIAMAVAAVFSAAPAEAARAFQDHSREWDKVWSHLLWDIGIVGALFLMISLYFLFRYRRTARDETGKAKELSFGASIAWAIIPVFVFLADDFYLSAQGWQLWLDQRTVPENAMEVKVTGQMWSWDFEYENGAISDNYEGLVVPVGQPVVLRMTSPDTIHSFFIPEFRIKEDLMPGRVTYLWFNPAKEGEFVFTCTEFCGTAHSDMWGKVKVVSRTRFDEWAQEHM